MRTFSLGLALATSTLTLMACGGHDDPAPPANQQAVVAPAQPTDPAASTGGTAAKTDGAKSDAPASSDAPADADKKDDPAKTTTTPPADKTDQTEFANLAQQLNDCLKDCKDTTCGSTCLSEFQAKLPAQPDVPATNAMCCAGDAFFVCHAAEGGDATCNADNPGPSCQAVPAMDVICKAKNQ